VQQKSEKADTVSNSIILKRVSEIREKMPRLGTRKLHYMLTDILPKHDIKIGRDKLFDLLEENGLLVRRRKRKHMNTTNSNHPFRKYPNLIRDLEVLRPNQLWVSDITYISLKDRFCYLSLVTDAYSRKIVGYCLYPTLQKEGPVAALKVALRNLPATTTHPLIHHSDRGLQYCCADYISTLEHNHVTISMTEKGDPYENALAERVNGILKGEFLLDREFDSFEQALAAVNNAIKTYNTMRPHASCNYQTPDQTHLQHGHVPMRWSKKKKKELIVA
jgi:transposase InsO family protein